MSAATMPSPSEPFCSTSRQSTSPPSPALWPLASSSSSSRPESPSPAPSLGRLWKVRRGLPAPAPAPAPLSLIPPPTPRLGAKLPLPSPSAKAPPISAPPTKLNFSGDGQYLNSPWAESKSKDTSHNPRHSFDGATTAIQPWSPINGRSLVASPVLTASSSSDSQDIESEIDVATIATEMALTVLRSDGHSSGQDETWMPSSDGDRTQDLHPHETRDGWPTSHGTKLQPPASSKGPIWDHEHRAGPQDKAAPHQGQHLLQGEGEPKRKGRARMSQEKRRRLARRKEREALMAMGVDPASLPGGSASNSPTGHRRPQLSPLARHYHYPAQYPAQQYPAPHYPQQQQHYAHPHHSPPNYYQALPSEAVFYDNALGLDLTALARKQMAAAVVRGLHYPGPSGIHDMAAPPAYPASMMPPVSEAPSSRWWTANDIAVAPTSSHGGHHYQQQHQQHQRPRHYGDSRHQGYAAPAPGPAYGSPAMGPNLSRTGQQQGAPTTSAGLHS